MLSTLAVAGLAASCSHPPVSHQRAAVADTVAIPVADASALEHTYAERLRLGLGSPYRLVESALRDTRLGNARRRVAAQLLHAIEEGRLYQVSPIVLVDAGADSSSALAQIELMGEAIERAPDPRAGELAVVEAYQQLARDSVLSQQYVATVVRVAALLRDRQLALADLRHLRRAAEQLHVSPADLVLRWRRERRFAVEQPPMLSLDANTRAAARRLALLLHGGIEAALTPVRSELARPLPTVMPALTIDDARRVIGLVDDTARPPQNALVITLRSIARGTANSRDRASAQKWQQLLEKAQDEEAFAAGLVSAVQDSGDDRVAARVALAAAVALRPFAQERLASTDSFSRALLRERFGVRVRTDSRLPRAWRQATLDDLGNALTDLRDVLPGIDLAGLTFDVRTIDDAARYQAYHDPRNRVIRIDPAAAAGTLAHEIGHDIDWQLARRKYNTSSSYATDFAVRQRKGLAYLVAAMQSDERPAEAFARRFEWYVAAALAAQGRSNGYLSSVQSDWISGYGAAARPDATLLARSSFAALLAQGAALGRNERAAAEQLIRESSDDCSADTLQTGPRAPVGEVVVFDVLNARRQLEVPQCTGLPWLTW
ncbi:MAG TPA: hypothetical protein VF021_04305 [Longimicrobiales bacterium]